MDVFDEDLFTDADRDSAWLQNMGGPRVRRWDGVKQAIQAIVSDTTLTTELILVSVTGMQEKTKEEGDREEAVIAISTMIVIITEVGEVLALQYHLQ